MLKHAISCTSESCENESTWPSPVACGPVWPWPPQLSRWAALCRPLSGHVCHSPLPVERSCLFSQLQIVTFAFVSESSALFSTRGVIFVNSRYKSDNIRGWNHVSAYAKTRSRSRASSYARITVCAERPRQPTTFTQVLWTD